MQWANAFSFMPNVPHLLMSDPERKGTESRLSQIDWTCLSDCLRSRMPTDNNYQIKTLKRLPSPSF